MAESKIRGIGNRMRRRRKDADAAGRGWGLTNRSRTRMEYEDRSREPSVRRAPSRFVRRPGNPECGFVRRPTFLFLPRSFGLLLVALFAFSPPFLGQESRKESGRCMHSDVVVDSGHEFACLSLLFPTRIPSLINSLLPNVPFGI